MRLEWNKGVRFYDTLAAKDIGIVILHHFTSEAIRFINQNYYSTQKHNNNNNITK